LITPYYVFDEVAGLIHYGKLPEVPSTLLNVGTGLGVRYHNDTLMRSLYDVNEIKMLVTSGEKLFKDTAFWKMLSQVRRGFKLKILLLDSDSPAVVAREESAYNDKERGFLKEEIRQNIETLKRMAAHFREIGGPIQIECKLYGQPPSFRMTFIGAQRLLVASYVRGERTGTDTIFYDLKQEGDLFYGFKAAFEIIESSARQVLC